MKIKLLILLLIIILNFQNQVLAYNIETHSYLTKETIDFYNKNFTNKIPNDLIPYLIDGSRKEDESPRWMNHFYDPIYNRGLTEDAAINPEYRSGNWQKSKEWANDSKNQNNIIYKTAATIFSILSAIEQRKISLISSETDFTWNRALKFYIQGEKEKAMYILGHILHLIQDASVPDHARNDPHPLGSPYEIYSSRYNLNNSDPEINQRLKNKQPIILPDLNSYFDNLATYSNNNFYSKDTIGIQSGYSLPQPDYDTKIGQYFYATKIDKENGDYYLFRKSMPDVLFSTKFDAKLETDLVLSSYWSRLSTKAIQNGAGVIDLFFKEAEKNKNNPEYLEKEITFWAKIKNITSNIINSIQAFGSQIFQTSDEFIAYIFNLNENNPNTYQIPINNNSNFNQSTENQSFNSQNKIYQNQNIQNNKINLNNPKPNNILNQDQTEPEEDFVPFENNQKSNNQTTTKNQNLSQTTTKEKIDILNKQLLQNFKQCSFETNQKPSYQGIIINELAWMGTPESSNNEWIELKNISNKEIDLNNWQLIDKAGQIKINFAFLSNTKIKPGQFLLLERTSDNTLPNIKADLIYTGVLSNSDEGLRLFDSNCNLIDEVLANPSWPAGDSPTRKTAERKSNLSWQTSVNSGGTPKAENSIRDLTNSTGGGGGNIINNSNISNNLESQQNQTIQSIQNILISEIQISPTNQRFIELYNPNNFDIDLTGYYLQRKTKTGSDFTSLVSKTYFNGKTIKAKNFFLISRENLDEADIILPNLTLSDSNSIQLIDKNRNVIDLIGWGETSDCQGNCAISIPQNQSLERKFENGIIKNTLNNFEDFQISNCPTPKSPPNPNCLINNRASQDAFLEKSNVEHILISEIFFDAKGSDEGKEFIELYNPLTEDVNLTNWSLKILKNNTTTETNLIKLDKNLIIKKDGGFFLIGFYNNLNNTDIKTSINIPNDFQAIILYDNNNLEIDRFNYNEYKNKFGLIPEGYSIERKAYQRECLNPILEGKFLGNGCDFDKAEDFTLNSNPNPQSTKNLKEPRIAPQILSLEANYNNQTADIQILWEEIKDAENQTSTITYKIIQNVFDEEQNQTSTLIVLNEQAQNLNQNLDGYFEKNIPVYELNKNYNYEFQAIDRDGLISTSSFNIFAKSFINEGYFFKDSKTRKYYFRIKFNPDYTFFNLEDKNPESPILDYQAIVFYLNQMPIPQDISTENGLLIPETNQIKVQYNSCGYGPNNALIIPYNKRSCIKIGGPQTWLGRLAYDFDSLEDNYLTVELLIDKDLAPNDYITLGFYKEWRGNLADIHFINFKALDSKKYYLSNDNSFLYPPNQPSNIKLSFDSINQKLNISADLSTDIDSLDSNIYYEYAFTTSTESELTNWQKTPNPTIPYFEINLEYSLNYKIGIRAVDEFENISPPIIVNWSFPENFLFLKQQKQEGEIANFNASAFAQIFKPDESGYLTGAKFKFSSYFIPHNYLRGLNINVSIYNYNLENFNDDIDILNQSIIEENKLGVSNEIPNTLIESNPEISFNFEPKIYLDKNKLYIWVLKLNGSYGHLAGTSNDNNVGGYGYASYSSEWMNQRNWLALTNYYFILIGER